MDWKLIHHGPRTQSLLIAGTDLWSRPWKTRGEETLVVDDPVAGSKPQRLTQYFVEADGKAYEFAATETAPGIWLIYRPTGNRHRWLALRLTGYVFGFAGTFILVHGFETSPRVALVGGVLLGLAVAADRYAAARLDSGNASHR
ncbi:hypothetical protein [Rubrivivax sp. JA1026]|uniref:hypothetical protein n=1 Tax=Rubrivivax sp. JA1026 TaxID=2710888 RepID=UPI0013E950FE|nr:hypothetical protein [Rubrivivax sp. JA1026]